MKEQFTPFLITCIIAIILLVLILAFLHTYEKKRLGLEGKIKNIRLKEKQKEEIVSQETSSVEDNNEVKQEENKSTIEIVQNTEVAETTKIKEERTIETNEEAIAQEVSKPIEENNEGLENAETTKLQEEPAVISSSEPTTEIEESNGLNVVTTTSTKFIETTIYNKSFNAQVVLQPNLKSIYKELNDEFLSYKNVHSRLSFKGVRYSIGRKVLAKIFVRGKRIYLYYALNPYDQDPKYHLKDVSEKKIGEDLPSLQKILSPRSVMYAKQLIEILMNNNEIIKLNENKIKEIDYSELLKPRSFKQLLEQGLIKAYKIKQEVPEGKEIKEKPQIEIKPEEVDEYVTDEDVDTEISYKNGKKSGEQAIINIGVINDYFDEEDEVTLEKLIEKHLVQKNAKQLKVLAHGILDKGLNVVADDFSKKAIKMIIYMGGTVTILK